MKKFASHFALAGLVSSLLFGLGSPSVADSAKRVICHRFAAPTGSDTNPGTKRSPFGSVQRLANSLSAGKTGCLRAGTYGRAPDGQMITISKAGRARAPITIRSFPGERAKIIGVVYVRNGANHVTLSSLRIEGTGGSNTVKIYAADVVVERSDITNVRRGDSCMILGSNSGWGQALRPIIRGNRFHDCGSPSHGNQDHGIYAANAAGGQINDNLFWNIQAYAIQLYPNAQHTRFAHNVVDGGGVLVGGDSDFASNNNIVEHNILSFAQSYNFRSYWEEVVGSGNLVRRNCLWAGGVGNIAPARGYVATGNLVANPQYLDHIGKDLKLRPRSRCLAVVGYDTAAKYGPPGRP